MSENLKMVRVNHVRCDERQAWTYVWAPADWDAKKLRETTRAAQAAYLEAHKHYREQRVAPNAWRYGPVPYASYPDMTVKDAKAMWDGLEADFRAWEKRNRETERDFDDFLTDQGFTSMWSHVEGEVDVDWGHRHGVAIHYGEQKTNTMPRPKTLAEIDADDDRDPWD